MEGDFRFQIIDTKDNVKGRIVFHLLADAGALIESIGHLCICHGRVKVGNKYEAYEVAFDCAEKIEIQSIPLSMAEAPGYVEASEIFHLKGSNFPQDCPLDCMLVEIIVGKSKSTSKQACSKRNVVIFSVSVCFKPCDEIVWGKMKQKEVVDEVLFDRMVVFSSSVTTTQHSPNYLRPCARSKSRTSNSMGFIAIVLVAVVISLYHTYEAFLYCHLISLCLLGCIATIWALSVSNSHLTSILYIFTNIQESGEWNGKSFFVNGWNAWSYCGSILQGQKPPIYSMPSFLVKAFHYGGKGTALPINLGEGTIPVVSLSLLNALAQKSSAECVTSNEHDIIDSNNEVTAIHNKQKGRFQKDYIASDMFTTLAQIHTSCQGNDSQDSDKLRNQSYAWTIGFLSQREQFGCISTNLSYDRLTVHASGDGVLISKSGGCIQTDKIALYATTDLANPFDVYMEMSSEENGVRKRLESPVVTQFISCCKPDDGGSICNSMHDSKVFIPTGWCSWYHFYEKINEEVLRDNINYLNEINRTLQGNRMQSSDNPEPLKIFQIDDGYQSKWGDWTTLKAAFCSNSNLPFASSHPLMQLTQKVRSQSLLAGLWLAPFACDKGSQLVKDHPEWILRDEHETAHNSANCGKFFNGLDVTNLSFQQHLRQLIHRIVHDWAFRYLKLDFLYAGALLPSDGLLSATTANRTLTRAQALYQGLKVILEASNLPKESNSLIPPHADQTFLVGCGAPLGSVIGLVHANRVSADAGLTWEPSFPLPSNDRWNLPCARNMIRNTITRSFMHNKWWINDPDCLMLRDSLSFTEDEIIAMATVKALSGGSILVSDDLKSISPGRLCILQKILPPSNQAMVVVDLMDRDMPELLRLGFTSQRRSSKNSIDLLVSNERNDEKNGEVSGTYLALSQNEDIFRRWTLFAACNWQSKKLETSMIRSSLFSNDFYQKKIHFISLRDAFGSDQLEDIQIALKRGPTTNNDGLNTDDDQADSCSMILHMFEFWSETYSCCEIDVLKNHEVINLKDIPFHGLRLFSMQLSLDPHLPLYLGSNIHFTCGLEVFRVFQITSFDHFVKEINDISHIRKSLMMKWLSDKKDETEMSPNISTICIEFEDFVSFTKPDGSTSCIWLFLPVELNDYEDEIATNVGVFRSWEPQPISKDSFDCNNGVDLVQCITSSQCKISGYIYKISLTTNHIECESQSRRQCIISWISGVK